MIVFLLRFKKLDLDGSGSLSIEEFMSLPELQQNPLVRLEASRRGQYINAITQYTHVGLPGCSGSRIYTTLYS